MSSMSFHLDFAFFSPSICLILVWMISPIRKRLQRVHIEFLHLVALKTATLKISQSIKNLLLLRILFLIVLFSFLYLHLTALLNRWERDLSVNLFLTVPCWWAWIVFWRLVQGLCWALRNHVIDLGLFCNVSRISLEILFNFDIFCWLSIIRGRYRIWIALLVLI